MTAEQRDRRNAAFAQLFLDYRTPILNYVYRLVSDAERAEELTQQAFVQAYAALDRLPADANHRAWLYRIATHVSYDHLRRRRLINWLPFRDADASPAVDRGTDGSLGQRDAVQRALSALSPADRAVLILFCVEEYPTAEIGKILGISPGAVKTRLCRARERFRQVFVQEGQFAVR